MKKKSIIAFLFILCLVKASAKERVISTDEYLFALSLFPREFPAQYDIYITDGTSPANGAYYVRPGAARLVGGETIYMNMGDLYNNCLANKGVFAHELTHVWQIVHYGSPWFIKEFIDNHVYCGIKGFITNDPNNPYKYTCDTKKKLSDYNAEQQGEVVRQYYLGSACETNIATRALSTATWRLMIGSSGRDIAIDHGGATYLTNTTGKIYRYDGKQWQQMPGSDGMSIASNAGHTLLTNTVGKIYKWSPADNKWIQLSGSDGVDVAVNSDGTYWLVNTAGKIYKMVNNKWQQMPGSDARRIGAGNGQVWMVNSVGKIYLWNGNGWNQTAGSAGRDVTISSTGAVFLTNTGGLIYQWNGSGWNQLDGSDGSRVSANAGKLLLINSAGRIYTRNI